MQINPMGGWYMIYSASNRALNEHHYREEGTYGGMDTSIDSRSEAAAATEDAVPDPNLYHGYGDGHGGSVSPTRNGLDQNDTLKRR